MPLTKQEVWEAIKQANVSVDKMNDIMEIINHIEEGKKEERADGPKKPKNQVVLFVMDDGTLTDKELIGYGVQIPADASPAVAYDKFVTSVRRYNNGARKAKKYPITKVGEGMGTLRGRWLKDENIKILTKEAVLVMPIKNDITDPSRVVDSID